LGMARSCGGPFSLESERYDGAPGRCVRRFGVAAGLQGGSDGTVGVRGGLRRAHAEMDAAHIGLVQDLTRDQLDGDRSPQLPARRRGPLRRRDKHPVGGGHTVGKQHITHLVGRHHRRRCVDGSRRENSGRRDDRRPCRDWCRRRRPGRRGAVGDCCRCSCSRRLHPHGSSTLKLEP